MKINQVYIHFAESLNCTLTTCLNRFKFTYCKVTTATRLTTVLYKTTVKENTNRTHKTSKSKAISFAKCYNLKHDFKI